jgi:hypothetical protein
VSDLHARLFFGDKPDLERFVGLTLADATVLNATEGRDLRVLELPPSTDRVLWTADRRTDRLNLLVSEGVVVRAAIF